MVLLQSVSKYLFKYQVLIILLTLLAAILRLLYIKQNMVFHGELGDNYLAMKNILMTGIIPLLGPPTSHPWLSFGPYFYWLFTPILLFVRYSPIGVAYVFAILHISIIPINYLYLKKIYSKRVAVISSFFIAISPAYIQFAHESRFFSLTLLLFYPFYYYFHEKKYLLSGIFFAVLLNFHLTPIVYLPALILAIYWQNKSILLNFLKRFILGFVIGMLPYILHDALNKFEMTKNILLWFPYRILGFAGIVSKNTVNQSVVEDNVLGGVSFIKQTFIPPNTHYSLYLFLIIPLIFVLWHRHKNIKLRENRQFILPLLLLIGGYIAIFIHGSPPSHYFLPLYPPLVIFVSLILSSLNVDKRLYISAFFLLAILNLSFFFSSNLYFINQSHVSESIPVPYTLQISATKAILLDAAGSHFSLKRVGPHDEFDQNYSQNYRYLLWKGGNEPVEGSVTIYTIYENKKVNPDEKVIFSEGGLIVTKTHEIDTAIT